MASLSYLDGLVNTAQSNKRGHQVAKQYPIALVTESERVQFLNGGQD